MSTVMSTGEDYFCGLPTGLPTKVNTSISHIISKAAFLLFIFWHFPLLAPTAANARWRLLTPLARHSGSHEVVNVNLKNKPQWYLALYAAGQVPALERDGAFVPESLVTCELLEELHPAPALLPAEPWRRAADRYFVHSFGMVRA